MTEETFCNCAFSQWESVIQSWLTTCPLLSLPSSFQPVFFFQFAPLSLVPFIPLNCFPLIYSSLSTLLVYLPLSPMPLILLCLIHRENKGRFASQSYLDDNIFEPPVISPRTRTQPARSYTIDTPYYSSETPEPSLKEDKPPPASSATGRAAFLPTSREVAIVDGPAGSDPTTTNTSTIRSSFHRSQSPAGAPLQSSPVSEHTSTVKTVERTTVVSSSSSVQKVPDPGYPLSRTQAEVEVPSSGSLYKQQPQLSSMEPKPPGVSRVSASLPRSYQRSDGARLTSVVTARPFGTQTSRITSLPRAFTVSTR